MAGDKLVCLRNNRRKGLFNGGLWVVKERPKPRRQIIRMRLKPDEDLGERLIKVSVRPECFTGAIEEFDWPQRKAYDEFDFGYVLTVHKAQGSQWDDVVLFDESGAFPRQPRPLALYRRDAGREAADDRGVNGAGRSTSVLVLFPLDLPHRRLRDQSAASAGERLLRRSAPICRPPRVRA